VDGSEGVCMFCEVLCVGPNEYMYSVMCCGWFVRSVCVFCDVLWMGPKECVCSVRYCVLVLMNVCVL
jgi:hypothetical protein